MSYVDVDYGLRAYVCWWPNMLELLQDIVVLCFYLPQRRIICSNGDSTRPFVVEDSILSIFVQLFGPKKYVSLPTKPFVFEVLLTIHSSAFWAHKAH